MILESVGEIDGSEGRNSCVGIACKGGTFESDMMDILKGITVSSLSGDCSKFGQVY